MLSSSHFAAPFQRTTAQLAPRADDPFWCQHDFDRTLGTTGSLSLQPRRFGSDGPHPVDYLAGMWVNMDSPYEQYSVEGFHVMRADYRGRHHFTLCWDPHMQQVRWGIHGKLRLEWLGKNAIAWVPDSYNARVWRWQRCGPAPLDDLSTHDARPYEALPATSTWMEPGSGFDHGYGPLRRPREQSWSDSRPYAGRPPGGATSAAHSPQFRYGANVNSSFAPLRLSERDRTRDMDASSGRSHGTRRNRARGDDIGRGGVSRGHAPTNRADRNPRPSSRRRERERWVNDRDKYPVNRRQQDHSRGYPPNLWRRPPRGPVPGTRLACGLTHNQIYDLLSRDITPEDYDILLLLDEGLKKPTANTESINALPSVSPTEFGDGECTVCMSSFDLSDDVAALPCLHHFHRGCITKWLAECRSTCPLCGLTPSNP